MLTFLFIIVGTITIYYSRGFRFNLKTQSIVQTGAIYLRITPPDGSININGRPRKNKSGFFQSGTLLTNLSPGIYKIDITKDKYSSWHKNVPVEPSEVSILDNIVLVSRDKRELISSSTEDFYARNNRLLTVEKGNIYFNDSTIAGDDVIGFTSGGTVISYGKKNKSYYLSNVFDLSSSLNLNAIFNNLKQTRLGLSGNVPITKIEPYSYNDRRFILMTGKALYTLDTEKLAIEQITNKLKDFTIAGNEVFWVSSTGEISSFNMVFRTTSKILEKSSLTANSFAEIKASSSGEKIAILDKAGKLFIIDRRSGTATSVSDSVTSFLFSPDNGILVFIKKNTGIYAYYLKAENIKDKKPIFIASQSSTIKNIAWYKDSHHLFIQDASGELNFIEIDNFLPINTVKIASNVNRFMYDIGTNLLYFDENSGIWKLRI